MGKYLEVELFSYMVSKCLTFFKKKKTLKIVFKVAVKICMRFLATAFPGFSMASFLSLKHTDKYIMVFH